jgi:glycosyltransferase involved in cell wall biosynthesis
MGRPTIAANVIAYNEEKNIKRCLDSVKGVVDEIILVHDGPCKDSTVTQAKKYTKKIFVRPRVGEAEPHRAFAMEKSSAQWILILDADEYLSPALRKEIRKLVQDPSVDGYAFYWSFYDKGKQITSGPLSKSYRLSLFRKSKTVPPRKFHEWYRVQGTIKRIPLTLEHGIDADNWTLSGFRRKNWPRARADARFRIINGLAPFPSMFYLLKSVAWFFLLLPYIFIVQRLFLHGWLGLRVAFLNALYNFLLYFYVFKFRMTGKLPW